MSALLKPLSLFAAAALLLAGAFVLLRSSQGFAAMDEKRREVQAIEEANETLRLEIERLQKRIEEISSRPDERERLIRERTNKAKPGETTVFVPEESGGTRR